MAIRGFLIVLSVADIEVLFYLFNFHFSKLITYMTPPAHQILWGSERDMYLPDSCH